MQKGRLVLPLISLLRENIFKQISIAKKKKLFNFFFYSNWFNRRMHFWSTILFHSTRHFYSVTRFLCSNLPKEVWKPVSWDHKIWKMSKVLTSANSGLESRVTLEAVKCMWASERAHSNTPPFALPGSTHPVQSARLFKYMQEDYFQVGPIQACIQITTFVDPFSSQRTAQLPRLPLQFPQAPFFLLSTSFPKTMFSNLSMLFQHLCVTVKEVIQQGQAASLKKFGKAYGNNTLAVLLQGYPVQLEWHFPLTQRWTLNSSTLTFYY